MEGLEVLQEFVVINPINSPSIEVPNTLSKDYKYWSSDNTRILIDCYAKYKKKVGSFEIRTMKKLWEIIAVEMKHITNENITATNCENRWKVLERNYKAYIDNNRKTGRGRKLFEFSQEMDQIFEKKKNVNPEVLLESETVDQNMDASYEDREILQSVVPQPNVTPQEIVGNEMSETPKRITGRKSALKRKISMLEQIREEKRAYYQEKLQVEKAKLQEMKRRNDLLEERNKILQKFTRNNLLEQTDSIPKSSDAEMLSELLQ